MARGAPALALYEELQGEDIHMDDRCIWSDVRALGYVHHSEEAATLGLSYFFIWRHGPLPMSRIDGPGRA